MRRKRKKAGLEAEVEEGGPAPRKRRLIDLGLKRKIRKRGKDVVGHALGTKKDEKMKKIIV